MPFSFNFGRFFPSKARAAAPEGGRFRIALLGDFSARAQRGLLERGDALAARKALKVDCDNLDQVLRQLRVKLTLDLGGGTVELPIASLDDFHPEQLFEKLEIFSELASLRERLHTKSTFAKAAAEVQSWTGVTETPPEVRAARGSVLPAEGGLSDFAQLLGHPSAPARAASPVEDLLRGIVGPHIVAAPDPRQEALVAAVDEALSATMRRVLHHPDFQALEALWRSVDLLVRRLETGAALQVVLIDLTAEELAAELSAGEALEGTGLSRWLVEQPAGDVQQGAYSVLVAHYTFARTRAHAELLGRLAKVASAIPAAVATAMTPDLLEEKPQDLPPEVAAAWTELAALPEAGYLALLAPSFLLRQPYGQRSEPVDCFNFEEITPGTGLHGFLWGHPAVLAGLLLGETFTAQGRKMTLGSRLAVGDLPFYYFTDQDGDQEALPCTEKMVTSRAGSLATSQGFIPLMSLKGSSEVRLGGFQSLAGRDLAGPWAPVALPAPVPAAEAAPPLPVAESLHDPELDALLSGLDTPAASVPAPAPEAAGDPGLDDLLASLEEPAPAAPIGHADAELDSLLSGLNTPAAPATHEDPELDALLSGLDAPAEHADPELDAMLAGLTEPEALDSTGDPELDALLAGLAPATGGAPAVTTPGALDPGLAELLQGL